MSFICWLMPKPKYPKQRRQQVPYGQASWPSELRHSGICLLNHAVGKKLESVLRAVDSLVFPNLADEAPQLGIGIASHMVSQKPKQTSSEIGVGTDVLRAQDVPNHCSDRRTRKQPEQMLLVLTPEGE